MSCSALGFGAAHRHPRNTTRTKCPRVILQKALGCEENYSQGWGLVIFDEALGFAVQIPGPQTLKIGKTPLLYQST